MYLSQCLASLLLKILLHSYDNFLWHSSTVMYRIMLFADAVAVAMQSEHETLDRQNQALTENLAKKVSRLHDVRHFHCIVTSVKQCRNGNRMLKWVWRLSSDWCRLFLQSLLRVVSLIMLSVFITEVRSTLVGILALPLFTMAVVVMYPYRGDSFKSPISCNQKFVWVCDYCGSEHGNWTKWLTVVLDMFFLYWLKATSQSWCGY